MKNSDIAALVVIASISMLVAYFVADAVIGKPTSGIVNVQTMDPISSTIVQPDASIFNKDAINPTVKVIIGDDGSTLPVPNSGTSSSNTKQ